MKRIELVIVLYFFLGMLEKISILQYFDYISALVIQIYCFIELFYRRENKNINKVFVLYTINIMLIVFITFRFIYLDIDPGKIINRIFPLISIFGMVIINSIEIRINKIGIIRETVKLYVVLGVLIIIDSFLYILIGKNLWPPIDYLGFRFSGPFYDSNFYGLTYAVILIIVIFYKNIDLNRKKFLIAIIVINIILAKSWSVIILLLFSIVFSKIIKFSNLFLKQIILLVIYLFSLTLISEKIELIRNIFSLFTTKYLRLNIFEAAAKFRSFELRIDTQVKALEMFSNNIFGKGPQQIVPNLGIDVHNSYVGFLFEMGIAGIALQLLNMRNKGNGYDEISDVLTTFMILMAFTINVHYSVIYTLIIFIVFNNKRNNFQDWS